MTRALVSWSTGKDGAWLLHELRRDPRIEVVGLLTAVAAADGRVAGHAIGAELLAAQAAAVGLPLTTVPLPRPCPDDAYAAGVRAALTRARASGVEQLAFGDLFLADVRACRERVLDGTGVGPSFPLWGRDSAALAREMIEAGVRAVVVGVDADRVPVAWLGREFDADLLADLPPGVDPCGENGEFHTFAYAGPMFAAPLAVHAGAIGPGPDGLRLALHAAGAGPGRRAIALVGPRAVGKSTLARTLATRLGWRALDTDDEIARRVGRPAGEHLAAAGEPAFRAVEREVCLHALAAPAATVLAFGGGAILDPDVRAALRRPEILTVFLEASIDCLVERQRCADVARPSLTELPIEEEVRAVLADRVAWYREVADMRLETFPANVDACAARISAKMGAAR